MFDRLVNAYRSRKLAVELALGRQQLGRVPSATAEVKVPIQARMTMQVIRADGTVEDSQVVGEALTEVPQSYLDDLRRQAGG